LKEAGCKTALTRGGGNGDDDSENRCGERCFDGRCRQYALGVKWAALGHFRVEEGGGEMELMRRWEKSGRGGTSDLK
jgi:hypothetical protein